jgi:hypothetical protein
VVSVQTEAVDLLEMKVSLIVPTLVEYEVLTDLGFVSKLHEPGL